jgi:hypothetical protein
MAKSKRADAPDAPDPKYPGVESPEPERERVSRPAWVGFDGEKYRVGEVREWPKESTQSPRCEPATVEDISIEGNLVTVVLRSYLPEVNGQTARLVRHVSGCTVCYHDPIPKELPPDIVPDPNDSGNIKHRRFLVKGNE